MKISREVLEKLADGLAPEYCGYKEHETIIVAMAGELLSLRGDRQYKIKMTECAKHNNVDAELCPICLMEERDRLLQEKADIIQRLRELVISLDVKIKNLWWIDVKRANALSEVKEDMEVKFFEEEDSNADKTL